MSWRATLQRLFRNRLAVVAAICLLMFITLAAAAPLVDRHEPQAQQLDQRHEAPGRDHWLGTDAFGRDQFSRLVHGARVSLVVGIASQAIALALGTGLGLAAGMGGRRADAIVMRVTDVAYAFPDLLLLILLVSLWGPSVLMITLAIAFVSWTTIARLVRGQVLSLREQPFVVAARSLGASDVHIAVRHLLPNVAGPVIVAATFGIPQAIFAEAALSFIGLGVPVPQPTWGNLVVDSKGALEVAPHLAITSCATVALAMMSFLLLGEGLRDALDYRGVASPRASLDVTAGQAAEKPALAKAA